MKKEEEKKIAFKLRMWLGKRGIRFFQLMKSRFGEISAVISLNEERKGVPVHPVHFREGMQVRNFLRSLPETENWSSQRYDDEWVYFVELALKDPAQEVTDKLQDSLPDYTLKTNAELLNEIADFGCGESVFHTADVERLIQENLVFRKIYETF